MKTKSIPEKAELMNNVDKILCDNCFEKYLFHLKNLTGEFTVGLTDILKCLAFAEKEGAVPPLPPQWWLSVERHLGNVEIIEK